MPQTKTGAQKAMQTLRSKFATEQEYHEWRRSIGAKGGSMGDPTNKGFASNRELAREAGRKGGKASRRTAIKQVEAETKHQDKLKESWRERVGL
jgi:general stress protein YciG